MPMNPQTEMGHEQKRRVSLGFGNLYASPGDHIGHFYRTSEEEKNVLIPFLKAGLKAREKCVCLISAGRRRQELQEGLTAAGIDAESALASGQLVVDEGKSEPKELQEMLGKALEEIPEKFPLLRWAGVMSWALKKISTTEKLMEWETHCNTVESPAAVFLCQYELAMSGFHDAGLRRGSPSDGGNGNSRGRQAGLRERSPVMDVHDGDL
ncbi:MAG: MEDS domain-containing protein, partial [Nitrososphaerales archaeon]